MEKCYKTLTKKNFELTYQKDNDLNYILCEIIIGDFNKEKHVQMAYLII